MRKIIAEDKQHYYTYSNDFLGGAFPVVNEETQIASEKADSQARWITPTGFDNLNKRINWNQHPKKPDSAKLSDLSYPYVKQVASTKAALSTKMYRPQDIGKPVFVAGSKNLPSTFSHQTYFKTVFCDSADDVANQEQLEKQREKDEWQSKMVVSSKHFKVNTLSQQSNQKDKMKGLLKNPVSKISLRLNQSKLSSLQNRQIQATQSLNEFPVSALMHEPYIMNEQAPKPLKARIDSAKTPFNQMTGLRETNDFHRYSKRRASALCKQATSRIAIKPLNDFEKVGPRFGRPTTVRTPRC